MASSSNDAPLWEASKENAAPLERGRNVRALEKSLREDSEEERLEKERMVRHYEKLVRPSESTSTIASPDDDPLIHWLSYIKFHQEAFPSDTHAQFLLMERCTRALLQKPQYQNDVRFIRVCVTYADKTSFPADVFKHLHQHKVGTQTALFWMAWAWVAESKGDFEFAEKVFKKGIAKQAKPLDKLKQRHKQFQRRFAKQLLKEREEMDQADDYDDDGRRGALHGLTEDRVRRNDRSVIDAENAPGQQRRAANQGVPSSVATFTDRNLPNRAASRPDLNAPTTGGFSIFVDDSENNQAGYDLDESYVAHELPQRRLEREVDRRKENAGAAERWNDRGGLGGGEYEGSLRRTEPSFAVYMDEECTAKAEREKQEKRAYEERSRHARDERTLKQRTDEDMAEKLARDPMRYVRNPSKLATEQGRSPVEASSKPSKSSLACGFDKRLVGKGSDGQECCFEEGRARVRYFRIADSSTAFNLLAAAARQSDDSAMDVSMGDSSTNDASANDRKPSAPQSRLRSSKKTPVPKALFSGDAGFDSGYNNMNNVSTASSTVNERDAVGAPTTKEEETINTKLAMKELSMMFSSPALGLNDLEPAVEEDDEEDGDTASFSLVAGLVDENAADNSILATSVQEEGDENDGPRNPDARDTAIPDFHQTALRTLEGDQGESAGARVQPARPPPAGFSIFCDDDASETAPAAGGFQIYEDNRESVGDTATFSVLEEALRPASGFPIFDEGEHKRESDGDTATFSVLADALKPPPSQLAAAAPFHVDNEEKRDCGGDTATFSMLEDATKAHDESVEVGKDAGFSIFMDDASAQGSKTDDFHLYRPQAASSPQFGDLSRIVPDDDLTQRIPSTKKRESDVIAKAAHHNYSKLHRADIKSALRQLQAQARESAVRGVIRPRDTDLTQVLSTRGYVDDLPSLTMPRAFIQSTSSKGAKIILGDRRAVVKEELGKGAYAKVVLLESQGTDTTVAVKAQAPTDCLALEYTILQEVEERVVSHCKGEFPFPRALSFVSVANGGLLGMTNGSQSGITLVDLVNVYKVLEDTPVPELVVFHYTILMLKILEDLHWHGKILHCDAKPDNWVLTSSTLPFDGCGDDEIIGSGLMLVDFGRAVDLKAAAKVGVDALDVRLDGSASEASMECVAMRKGLSWSFDVDTFGLCAGVHVLLYGTHIEVECHPSTRRWMPRKPLRRYWNKDLWKDLFDTLLNLDALSQTALGSRPKSLRELRRKLAAYVETRSSELESLLRHQSRILPSQRLS